MPTAAPYVEHFSELEPTPSPFTTKEWMQQSPAVRRGAFFSATVEDERLLGSLRNFVQKGLEEGWTESQFVNNVSQWMRDTKDALGIPYRQDKHRMTTMTDAERKAYDNDVRNIDSRARLRLIFRTQAELANGFRQFIQDLSPENLKAYPGWRFFRQPGALTKRLDHVIHDGDIRLKTDVRYWLARNKPSFGGFDIPHAPFGFNSWMRVTPVPRKTCETLELIKPGEPVKMPDEKYFTTYGLPRFTEQSLIQRSGKSFTPDQIQTIINRAKAAGINVTFNTETGRFETEGGAA